MSDETTNPHYHELELPVPKAKLFHRAAQEIGIATAVQYIQNQPDRVKIGFFNFGGQAAANAMYDRVSVLEAQS